MYWARRCFVDKAVPVGAVISVGSDLTSPRKGNVIGRLSVQKLEKIRTGQIGCETGFSDTRILHCANLMSFEYTNSGNLKGYVLRLVDGDICI